MALLLLHYYIIITIATKTTKCYLTDANIIDDIILHYLHNTVCNKYACCKQIYNNIICITFI